MNTLLLVLLDSRAPAGAHHHSGGMEAAVTTGLVADLASAGEFCRGRLRTNGRVAAAFAAAACLAWHRGATPAEWAALDEEFDARTPSEAMRAGSRQLGGGLRRLAGAILPDVGLRAPWVGLDTPAPHHPLVLGAAVAAAGGSAELAARAAALATCSAPASAAVRLLGLDPFAVHALLAELADEIDNIAVSASTKTGAPADLAADSAPALELLADFHLTREVRLFAS